MLLKRIAPVLLLLVLSPLVAEFLLGDFTLTHVGLLVPFSLVYGAGAILIRELARRAGGGEPQRRTHGEPRDRRLEVFVGVGVVGGGLSRGIRLIVFDEVPVSGDVDVRFRDAEGAGHVPTHRQQGAALGGGPEVRLLGKLAARSRRRS